MGRLGTRNRIDKYGKEHEIEILKVIRCFLIEVIMLRIWSPK